MVRRVPFTGDEKLSLHVSLDRHRDAVLWKLEGLADDDLRRPMTQSGTNLLGLVKHVTYVEKVWFNQAHLFHPSSLGEVEHQALVEAFETARNQAGLCARSMSRRSRPAISTPMARPSHTCSRTRASSGPGAKALPTPKIAA